MEPTTPENNAPPSDTPACPICLRTDAVQKVSELAPSTEPGVGQGDMSQRERLAAPVEPAMPPPLLGRNEGLGCLAAIFFGAAFFLSFSYAAWAAVVIFGTFLLVFAAFFFLSILRGRRAQQQYEQRLSTWQMQMETWERLFFCSRDCLVFDPSTGRQAAPAQISDLLNG